MNKVYLSWSDVGNAIDNIIFDIRKHKLNFTRVVGIARGGIIPAATIANKLNLPLDLIYYSSKAGRGAGLHNNTVPTYGDNEVLLVVDDLTDTGRTLQELRMTLPSGTVFAVMWHKATSMFSPEIRGYDLAPEECHDWLVFPYEPLE